MLPAHLDVAVDAALLVHILQRAQHIAHDGCNHHLVQPLHDTEGQNPVSCPEVRQLAWLQQLAA